MLELQSMPEPQTQANHRRFQPLYHFFFLPVLLLLLAYAGSRLLRNADIRSAFEFLLVVEVAVAGFLSRVNALKVQDRVIRLEERLRLAALLPSHLVPTIHELTERQLVALRFASDEELPALAARARTEGLNAATIKSAIKKWRPDHLRV